MNSRFFPGLIFAFFLRAFSTSAQDLPNKIQQYFEAYQKETPPEKAYLDLDKQTYTLGESVWFSAFLVAGSSQIPSPLSQTLYVDIFDGDGVLLEQKIIYLENGRGKGNYDIPTFGKAGNYQIKAYTAWMRNFGLEYFFTGGFSVVDGAGGSFLPKVQIQKIESNSGKATYTLEITAIDQNGNPLANKTLSFIAWGDGEELHSQDLSLNTQGQANFSFSIPEKAFASQHLELTYKENENYETSQKIRLPYSLNLADIQFLPEGGNWALNKKSNMAFRVVAPDGVPLEINGKIEGTEITFESNFAGLGKFEITPTESYYKSQIEDSMTGQKREISLPGAQVDGLVLQVVNNPVASYLTAFVQGNYEPNSLILASQTRGIINYMIQGSLTNGVWGVRIPKENLISGINQITVMTQDGKPLLERLVFIRKETQELTLTASTSASFSPREKVSLDLKSALAGSPAPGSFSIAILDADQVEDESNRYGTILSNLLLTSDLQGHVYNPGYYFKDQEPETMESLDLVMLTHGWRRFNWSQILNNDLPKVENFIERGINIEGQISDQEDTKKGMGGGKVTALVGDGIEIVNSEYGPNGRFIIRDLQYVDSAIVTITAEDTRLKNFVDVEIVQPEAVFTSIPGNYPIEIKWPKDLIATYQERNLMNRLSDETDIMDLEEVVVEDQTIEKETDEIRKIYGSGDVTIDPEKIPGSVGYTNVFQLIQGRVAGVKVYVAGTDVNVQIRGVGSINAGTSPLYLLDNIPVDANTLMQVNPHDVASVDVFKDPAKAAIFGAEGANGVIAVYTKTGAGVTSSVGGTLVTNYGGYSIAKEFYQPNYAEKTAENSNSDKRATIFWKPILEIDESGKASIEYYNTDISKKHRIVIEGIDSEGRLARFSQILN
ncbi:TonB-dependent receptor plug domain-containing protein [Algoriphagus zhangzhouensis]|uniref:TonB-dependent outer membrane receptor, SusC/RagA subfamily, signature region n=1 Tax=Algoriphagus zhangzhouensis TaxID=1073327 RepID=A0A1M7ZGJ2_9BACT|nr:TonB-dependent receptor plug domain-containing protein [Algoriphagus zhangzhouensis]TDY44756.1 TonB-dependent SusC/RagA subfamily outer membrane receptor [Algoriphagus zhangzhouensis]SHO63952.1 TonB-dependent outer membrane receptor, SusC/RagA subfamily, signature region [Algoriphagus zhangzhouensis]